MVQLIRRNNATSLDVHSSSLTFSQVILTWKQYSCLLLLSNEMFSKKNEISFPCKRVAVNFKYLSRKRACLSLKARSSESNPMYKINLVLKRQN